MKSGIAAIIFFICSLFFSITAYANMKDDIEFIEKTVIANKFAFESSQLALKRSSDPNIKALAQQIIEDNVKIDNDLKDVLTKLNINKDTGSIGLGSREKVRISKLESFDPKGFDKLFFSYQEKVHEDFMYLLQKYAANRDNPPALKAFATRTLPKLKAHHERISLMGNKKHTILPRPK